MSEIGDTPGDQPRIEHAAALAARADELPPWSPQDFEALLREKGTSYHIYHPFHVMMAEGKLTRAQLQGWVANRFYYQISMPPGSFTSPISKPSWSRMRWIHSRRIGRSGQFDRMAASLTGIEIW